MRRETSVNPSSAATSSTAVSPSTFPYTAAIRTVSADSSASVRSCTITVLAGFTTRLRYRRTAAGPTVPVERSRSEVVVLRLLSRWVSARVISRVIRARVQAGTVSGTGEFVPAAMSTAISRPAASRAAARAEPSALPPSSAVRRARSKARRGSRLCASTARRAPRSCDVKTLSVR